jgi:hypothetical protein
MSCIATVATKQIDIKINKEQKLESLTNNILKIYKNTNSNIRLE